MAYDFYVGTALWVDGWVMSYDLVLFFTHDGCYLGYA
jgi:hypothetical protein